MGIAMLSAARLVQVMPQWIEDWRPRLVARLGRRGHGHVQTGAQHQTPARPLRVLRVLEPQQPRAAAGRMVISGRMDDVCAELDRLAAAEAQEQRGSGPH